MSRLRPLGERPRDGLSRTLGEALRAARGTVSRRTYAQKIGVEVTTLQDLELGRGNPTLDTVERVAQAYGLGVTLTVEPEQ